VVENQKGTELIVSLELVARPLFVRSFQPLGVTQPVLLEVAKQHHAEQLALLGQLGRNLSVGHLLASILAVPQQRQGVSAAWQLADKKSELAFELYQPAAAAVLLGQDFQELPLLAGFGVHHVGPLAQAVFVFIVVGEVGMGLGQKGALLFEVSEGEVEDYCKEGLVSVSVAEGLPVGDEGLSLEAQKFVLVEEILELKFEEAGEVDDKVGGVGAFDEGGAEGANVAEVHAQGGEHEFIEKEEHRSLQEVVPQGVDEEAVVDAEEGTLKDPRQQSEQPQLHHNLCIPCPTAR
jgi:hypothetical protein